jgi:predicted O-methyltransferase YrrM
MSTKVQPTWPAELYAQARPDYPPQIISAIFDAPTSSAPLNIIDLGAGTGICTKLLIQACQKSANGKHQLGNITSLDAAPNMLKELARTLFEKGGLVPELQEKGELDRNVETNTGVATFESFDAATYDLQGKVDLITIAQVSSRSSRRRY